MNSELKIRYLLTFTFTLLTFFAQAQLRFSASVGPIGNTVTVTIMAQNPTGGTLNLSAVTTVLYFDDDETSFSSANFSSLDGLGWSTSGNTSTSESNVSSPLVTIPIVHNRRLEVQAFDDNGVGTDVGPGSSVTLFQIVFDNSDGSSPTNGGEAYLASAVEDGIGSASGIQYFDNNANGFDILTTGVTTLNLPVELLEFEAEAQSTSVILSWTSLSELNFSAYELQRSSSIEEQFSKIALIPGLGNINQKQVYDFVDSNVEVDVDYYYRLKMIDLDGSIEYSPIRSVRLGTLGKLAFSIVPNPASNELNIQLKSGFEERDLFIFNLAGNLVYQSKLAADARIINVQVADWNSGQYMVVLESKGKRHTSKLIITK